MCLKKLVLEAATTGFQDPARTARSPQREELCWKGSVEGQWMYTHESRRTKKEIPDETIPISDWLERGESTKSAGALRTADGEKAVAEDEAAFEQRG